MVLKYQKLFTTVNPLNQESVTVLVESVVAGDFRGVAIQTLEGEYETHDEFMEASDHQGDPVKLFFLLPLTLSDTQLLVDALNGALQAARGP